MKAKMAMHTACSYICVSRNSGVSIWKISPEPERDSVVDYNAEDCKDVREWFGENNWETKDA